MVFSGRLRRGAVNAWLLDHGFLWPVFAYLVIRLEVLSKRLTAGHDRLAAQRNRLAVHWGVLLALLEEAAKRNPHYDAEVLRQLRELEELFQTELKRDVLDSPGFEPKAAQELRDRGFERRNRWKH
jgi:hypothetical protein